MGKIKNEYRTWKGQLRLRLLQRMIKMELLGMKKRERQEKRFLDVVKENMESVSVTEEGATDRVNEGRWPIVATHKSSRKEQVI